MIAVIAVAIVGAGVWQIYSEPAEQQATSTTSGITVPTSTATASSTLTSTSTPAGNPVVGAGAHCGGNMTTAPTCAAGYQCEPVAGSHLPFGDVGGTCVAVPAQSGPQY
jgi:hypothetical protein